jgi:hypothetical protein
VINQALFEHLFISMGLLGRPRISAATFREPLTVLAEALPSHVARSEEPAPDLVFGGRFE